MKAPRSQEVQERPPFTVTLWVNGTGDAVVGDVDPVVFTVNLTNVEAIRSDYHNRTLEEGVDELRLDELDARLAGTIEEVYESTGAGLEPREVPRVEVGSEAEPWASRVRFHARAGRRWTDLGWPLLQLEPDPEPVAVLSPDSFHSVDFGLDPGVRKGIRRRTYVVVASVPFGDAEVRSEPVTVRLTREVERDLEGDREPDLQRVITRAAYLLRRGLLDEARGVVEAVPDDFRDEIPVRVLLGDLAQARGLDQEAFEHYEAALEAFHERHPDPPEPPGPLMRRLEALHRRLTAHLPIEEEHEGRAQAPPPDNE